ncbi:MAG TPA: hypothetical protein VJ871_08045 [Bacteroidales bacterium]|jgi:hypothetical protein|nr:hypothetical protein [Bacteroidales bacterium]
MEALQQTESKRIQGGYAPTEKDFPCLNGLPQKPLKELKQLPEMDKWY